MTPLKNPVIAGFSANFHQNCSLFTVLFQELPMKPGLPVMVFAFVVFHDKSSVIKNTAPPVLGYLFGAFLALGSQPQNERPSQFVDGPAVPPKQGGFLGLKTTEQRISRLQVFRRQPVVLLQELLFIQTLIYDF
jgi:hypothetical protein